MATASFTKEFSVNKLNSSNYAKAFMSEKKMKINKTAKSSDIKGEKLLQFLNEVEK